jgi:hypothetical protein
LKGTPIIEISKDDDSVDMEERLRKYLKEYQINTKLKRIEFFNNCKQNGIQGLFAKLIYNLAKAKIKREYTSEELIVDGYLDDGMEMLTKDVKRLKAHFSATEELQVEKRSSILTSRETPNNRIFALQMETDKKRSVSLVKREVLKDKLKKSRTINKKVSSMKCKYFY